MIAASEKTDIPAQINEARDTLRQSFVGENGRLIPNFAALVPDLAADNDITDIDSTTIKMLLQKQQPIPKPMNEKEHKQYAEALGLAMEEFLGKSPKEIAEFKEAFTTLNQLLEQNKKALRR